MEIELQTASSILFPHTMVNRSGPAAVEGFRGNRYDREMRIYVDADSCPAQCRAVVIRAARKRGITAVFAANRLIPGIEGENLVMELCPEGKNAADNRIVRLVESGDIVITRDIPLAARLVDKNVDVLDDRGHIYNRENVRTELSLRNFVVALAESGDLQAIRTATYNKRDVRTFAASFDRLVTHLLRGHTKNSRPLPVGRSGEYPLNEYGL
jgi:uncharacterized protein YaiI (UPF0178 family)